MMVENEQILVLAEPGIEEELLKSFGGGPLIVNEPYEALLKMSRRRWKAVLLCQGAADDDFAGMCRATRRLCGDDGVYAICTPRGEPDVAPLVGELIDDYFIHPPTTLDVRSVLESAGTPSEVRGTYRPSPATPVVTSAGKLSALIDSTQNVASLENRLVEIIGAHIGRRVWWDDADKISGGDEPILLSAGDVPRVLLADKSDYDARGDTFVETIQQCLPALTAAARRAESLHRLAVTDHLTGAYNRRYFYHLTDQILSQGRCGSYRVTLLLYDIDDFKRYNDTYGHAAGDEILKSTAAIMKRITRSHDVVSRIGGDEFAVLFWDPKPRTPDSSPPRDAYVLAHRFRQAVTNHSFPSLGPEGKGVLTISGGLANHPSDGTTCRQLLKSADGALRKAKESGKNNIFLVGNE